jgi:rSAM/selenodomain-associated transferase 2
VSDAIEPEPFVSVIIPVLRDNEQLAELLPLAPASPDVQVIVVSGEPDGPPQDLHARCPGLIWVTSEPGRARQMNVGAARAGGRWLLFLHADARLPAGWLDELQRLDRGQRAIGGSFGFSLRSPRLAARVIEWGVAQRVRWLGLPYGDQALFARREAFEALDGYREMPVMEDVDFVRRLGRKGPLEFSQLLVSISARRWERDGWMRRTMENTILISLYWAGIAPERLARRYYRKEQEGPTRDQPVGGEAARASATARSIAVVIPALNEEEAIGQVLSHVPSGVARVVVADNGSTDATADRARARGAHVVTEPRRGYGRACRRGLTAIGDAEIVVFLDADFSDSPEEMTRLVSPILENRADLVLGDRSGASRPVHARLGTWLCVACINALWGAHYRDLGPFRAIRRDALERLALEDETWGWTIEMQVKALDAGLRVLEVPVSQRPRIGQSKISGTVRGTLRAAARMLSTIVRLRMTRRQRAIAGAPAKGVDSRSGGRILGCGLVLTAIMAAIAIIDPRGEVMTFLALLAAGSLAYLFALRTIAVHRPQVSTMLWICLTLGVVWRLPFVAAPPRLSNDIYRYVWDGRVQRLGHNPYVSAPGDPGLQHLHSPVTRLTEHAALPTIYPPAAELYFRLVAAAGESVLAFKLAFLLCDLLTIAMLWRILRAERRSPWWLLGYAWHPLVVLEGIGGGHVDLLGVLLISAVVLAFAEGRRVTGAVLFALAAAVKFLPVVLVPLFWRRLRLRDVLAGVTALAGLYLWFVPGSGGLPTGSLRTYAENWRFNGPAFRAMEAVFGERLALAVPIVAGLLASTWARRRWGLTAPEAWAWPMAAALFFLPAIYPWYLLWLTPFLGTAATLPLLAWSLTIPLTHVVWQSELAGSGWVLPPWVPWVEYSVVLAVALVWHPNRTESATYDETPAGSRGR